MGQQETKYRSCVIGKQVCTLEVEKGIILTGHNGKKGTVLCLLPALALCDLATWKDCFQLLAFVFYITSTESCFTEVTCWSILVNTFIMLYLQ